MTTIEMHNTGKGLYGNGLIARGYIREAVRSANMPESAIRSWSYGLGRGLSGVVQQTSWAPGESSIGGEQ
ncbi:MAG: hypothetical protein HQL94_09780 [Magnetococcales bacterium]|nr:hypothetical protein [Magnetococcales bacterium]MBF0438199.1 hypothetical protein [Magnetococcales bacterium]